MESGKVDRNALPEPAHSATSTLDDEPPIHDLERVVRALFADVLGHSPPSTRTSFFLLGGHSLQATRVVAQILKIFRVRLPMRAFFDAPSVAGVSAAVTAAEAKPGQAQAIATLFLKLQQMTPEERHAMPFR